MIRLISQINLFKPFILPDILNFRLYNFDFLIKNLFLFLILNIQSFFLSEILQQVRVFL